MTTVWMNHWFSTAVNIIDLLRANGQDVRIICTNEHEYSVIKNVSDEWYQEPVLQAYQAWKRVSGTPFVGRTILKTGCSSQVTCFPIELPSKGDDHDGEVYSQRQTEQKSSEGTQPSAPGHLGLQPRHKNGR